MPQNKNLMKTTTMVHKIGTPASMDRPLKYAQFIDPGKVREQGPAPVETADPALITKLHIPGGSMHELVSVDEGALYGDKVVAPCGSEMHSGSTPALEASKSKRMNRPIGYGSDDEHRNSPLEETLEHMLSDTGR